MLDNPLSALCCWRRWAIRPGPARRHLLDRHRDHQVTIPTKGIGREGFEEYEGKTFSIRSVQHVTVFVKKA